jgi:FlaA1/EpsC-like NDP-sugar epimerase
VRMSRIVRGDGLSRVGTRLASASSKVRSDLPLATLDVVLIAAAYSAILFLRFDGSVPSSWLIAFTAFLPIALGAHLAMNWVWGLYGQMWRHASVEEARRVALAGASAAIVLSLLFLLGERRMPLSVVLLGAVLATALVGGLRFQSRLFAFQRDFGDRQAVRVAVIGAGESGATIVREMRRHPEAGLAPVVVLDDDARKQGLSLSGIPIIGGVESLPDAVNRYRAEQALLAIPSADGQAVRRIANAADAVGLTLKVLPSVTELVGGDVSVRDVRDLSIDDLLGRQQVTTDLVAVRRILQDRRVLITGAGGSIGAEIARQVAACSPAALLLLDHDETHLHDAAATVGRACEQLLADICDGELMHALFDQYRPEVVFHAAAHKHVPLLESHPCQAIATNVLGTQHVISASLAHGVERFVLISTDKAVRPENVMGASKRLAEQLLVANAPATGHYCAVRFGNVLGSRGSVIPTFMRQIQEGGPVTITDPRMTRFFMSISEAVQLVLQSAALSEGGEIFMLDMGEPVRIVELAERMIRLSGRRVGTDIAVRVVGTRAGETLYEELHSPDEHPFPTTHPSIVVLYPTALGTGTLEQGLARLVECVRERDGRRAASELAALATTQSTVVRLPDPEPARPVLKGVESADANRLL